MGEKNFRDLIRLKFKFKEDLHQEMTLYLWWLHLIMQMSGIISNAFVLHPNSNYFIKD